MEEEEIIPAAPIMKLFNYTDVIIFEVFVRLPTRDVVCAKCTCTPWYKLLSSPYFTDYYKRNSHFTTTLLFHRSRNNSNCLMSDPLAMGNAFFLLEVTQTGDYFRTHIKPESPKFYIAGTRTILTFSNKYQDMIYIIGSCNGLIFLLQRKLRYSDWKWCSEKVYLFNPLFNGYIKLPCVNKKRLSETSEYKSGYIPSTDTYKLVRLVFSNYEYQKVNEAGILTVGKDTKWRNLVLDHDYLLLFRRTSNKEVSFKGTYYWINYSSAADHDHTDDQICTFDFEEEKCGRISNPPSTTAGLMGMELRILKDSLCLVDSSDLNRLVIWTMKEYPADVKHSLWSKNVVTCRFDLLPIKLLNYVTGVQISDKDNNGLVISFSRENHKDVGLGMCRDQDNYFGEIPVSYTPRFCPFTNDVTRLQLIKKHNLWSKYFPKTNGLITNSRRGKHHLKRKEGTPWTRPKLFPNLH